MKTQTQIIRANRKANKASKFNNPVLFTKEGLLIKHAKSAIYLCKIEGNLIHHTYSEGFGNYGRTISNYRYISDLLKYAGLKFTEGNDAPRGGQCGNYIKCSKKAIELLLSLK